MQYVIIENKKDLRVESEILTIDEVADYLRVSSRTVYEWAQKGEIPAGKIGTAWRFQKAEVERWVNERLTTKEKLSTQQAEIRIANLLSPDRIVYLNHATRRDALIALADVLGTAPQIKHRKELRDEILKREELMSTAIGCGIAIPHVRLASVTDLVMAVGISKKDIIDFNAIDGEPVNLIFMIAAAKNQHEYYLQTLAFFSTKIKDPHLRSALLESSDAESAYRILTEET